MASRLLNVLHDIETERQRAVYNANKAGFDLPQNASIAELADCFIEAVPNYLSDDIIINPEDYHLPSYLYDAKSILLNAPAIEKDGVTLYPYVIYTFADDAESALLNYNMIAHSVLSSSDINYATMLRTSDGFDYAYNNKLTDVIALPTNSSTITHVWGDVAQKYILLYGTSKFKTSSPNLSWNYKLGMWSYSSSALSDNAITQIIHNDGQCDTRLYDYTGNVIGHAMCNSLMNLEYTASCAPVASSVSYLYNLRRISMPGMVRLYDSSGNSSSNHISFYALNSLEYVDLPLVETLDGESLFTGCKPLYFNIPKLHSITGTLFSNNTRYSDSYVARSPIILKLPNCVTWNNAGGCAQTQYLELGQCDFKMTDINPQTFYDTTNIPVKFNNVKRFKYGANSQLHFLRFDNMIEYTFEEPCTLQGFGGWSLNEVDLEKVTLLPNTTTNDIYLGNAPLCHTVIWPHEINSSLDITGYPHLSEDTMHELIEHLASGVVDCYVKMTAQCYDKLSAEDIAIAEHEGWEVINNG